MVQGPRVGLAHRRECLLQRSLVVIYFSLLIFLRKKRRCEDMKGSASRVDCHRSHCEGWKGLHHSVSVKKEPETGMCI